MMTTPPVQPETATLLDARPRTDHEISTKWVWAPIASYATWAAIPTISYLFGGQTGFNLAIPTGTLGVVGFIFSAASSLLVYQLVNRRNQHFAREESLLWASFDSSMARASQSDMRTQLALGSAERDLAQLTEAGKEHSAVLWALLTLIPYAGWIFMTYTLAFLTHDMLKHERQEDLVIENLSRISQGLPSRARRTPNRPVILYVLAGLATLGIFLLFWVYQAVKDPQPHFEHHRAFETVLGPASTMSGSVGGPY